MLRFDRRRFLTALGLGGASFFLPSLSWWRGRRGPAVGAPAQAADPQPKRVVFFLTHHGTMYDRWAHHRGNPADQDWEYALDDDFSEILAPLAPRRDDLLIVDGLANLAAYGDRKGFNEHTMAQLTLLTGAHYRGDDNGTLAPGGPSIDQIIGQQIRSGPAQFKTRNFTTGGNGTFLALGEDQKGSAESDPRQAFETLFGMSGGDSDDPRAEALRAGRASVLDFVGEEYDHVLPRLGADDRRKLSDHRDLIRDLEKRLAQTPSCGDVEEPTSDSPHHKTSRLERFSELTAMALACDLTRVVTVEATQMNAPEFGAPATKDIHHDYAHDSDWRKVERGEATEDWVRAAQGAMVNYNHRHAEDFRALIDAIDAVPEGGAGGSMLDNTVLVWLTELATGWHTFDRIPVVIAGNLDGQLHTGRYVHYAQRHRLAGRYGGQGPTVGPAHSQLLVSLAQAAGANLDALPATTMDRYLASGQTPIDLTGPLSRL